MKTEIQQLLADLQNSAQAAEVYFRGGDEDHCREALAIADEAMKKIGNLWGHRMEGAWPAKFGKAKE